MSILSVKGDRDSVLNVLCNLINRRAHRERKESIRAYLSTTAMHLKLAQTVAWWYGILIIRDRKYNFFGNQIGLPKLTDEFSYGQTSLIICALSRTNATTSKIDILCDCCILRNISLI